MSIRKVLNYTSTNLHGQEKQHFFILVSCCFGASKRKQQLLTMAINSEKQKLFFLHPINTYIKFTQMAS